MWLDTYKLLSPGCGSRCIEYKIVILHFPRNLLYVKVALDLHGTTYNPQEGSVESSWYLLRDKFIDGEAPPVRCREASLLLPYYGTT